MTPVPHPGRILYNELIKENNLKIVEVAASLSVSRQALSGILNGKAAITPEMALRIAVVFGGTPDIWLRLQYKYDLQAMALKVKKMKLRPYQYDEK